MALIAFCCYFKVPEVHKKVVTEKVPVPEKVPAPIPTAEEIAPLQGIFLASTVLLMLGVYFSSLVVYMFLCTLCLLYLCVLCFACSLLQTS